MKNVKNGFSHNLLLFFSINDLMTKQDKWHHHVSPLFTVWPIAKLHDLSGAIFPSFQYFS